MLVHTVARLPGAALFDGAFRDHHVFVSRSGYEVGDEGNIVGKHDDLSLLGELDKTNRDVAAADVVEGADGIVEDDRRLGLV